MLCQMNQVGDDNFMKAEAADLTVGSRCQVDPGNKRGAIRLAMICILPSCKPY